MPNHDQTSDPDLSRRDALRIAVGVGAAAIIPLVPAEMAEAAQRAAARPVALKFFTPAQHRTAEALTEVIIPADARSPGARAAKVADYLDFTLNEASPETRQAWKDGLTALDAASATEFGKPFVELTTDQQVALVTQAASNEQSPTTPLEKFFVEAKGRTIHGYYTSEIGIHQELKYKGNQFLTEFVGCDHPEHHP